MKTEVTINIYKESGKWYDEVKFTSSISCVDSDLLKEEAKTKFSSLKSNSYTIEAWTGDMMYKALIIQ